MNDPPLLKTRKFKPPAISSLIQSSSEFISGFVPPDYILDGILQRRFIYSITGRTGSGKTAIILLLAASVARELLIGARQAQKGRVLYLAGENPDDIRMRWIAMAQYMNFDTETIDVHFIPGTFKISAMMERIELEAQRFGPFQMVIVDTSAAFFEGNDENSNTDQGAHARRLRGLVKLNGGPCVIVACHPPKNANSENLQPRGGGAFIAEMDGNLTTNMNDGVTELHWQGKFRGPEFAPISFQLRSVTHERLKDTKDRLIPTVIASYMSEAAQDEIAATARANEDRVLAVYADTPAASLADIARRLGWLMKTDEPDKMKVKRIVGKLAKAKLVTIERGKAAITDKGIELLPVATAKAGNG